MDGTESLADLRAENARLKAECAELRRLAYRDPLTGLPNRRAWIEELKSRSDASQPAGCTALALFDIDHFKKINDGQGFAVGDEVLQHVGLRLSQLVAPPDFAARLGGDEFGLLITGEDETAVRQTLDAIRSGACEGLPPQRKVAASIGYVTTGEEELAAAYLDASAALCEAKEAGRNCVVGKDTKEF